MSDPKSTQDPLDAPEPRLSIPRTPGQVDTPSPSHPRQADATKPKEDPAALAKRLAEQARAKAKATKPTPPASAASVAKVPSKRKSAAELLAEAREREAQAAAPRRTSPSSATPQTRAPTGPAPSPAASIEALAPGARIVLARPVGSDVALRAVWKAHLSRARATGDLELAVTAGALLAAVDRLGAAALIVAHVAIDGAEHVVWLDQRTGQPVASATPAEVYLAGS